MNKSQCSPALLHLQNLRWILWVQFLLLTALGFVVMPFSIGESQIYDWWPGGTTSGQRQVLAPSGMESALVSILGAVDAFWILLAAVNVYLALVAAEGLTTARRWAAVILGSPLVLGWVGAKTGFPFGPCSYTDRMGWRFGGVLPFAVPLLWFVVVICSRWAVLWLLPKINRAGLAIGVGALALLTDLNLEFVAWKSRAYWIWYPGRMDAPAWPPMQNYVTWFVVAAVMSWFLIEEKVASPARRSTRPIIVLILVNALFLSIHAARWIL